MVAIASGVTTSYLASTSGLTTSATITGASLGSVIGIKHALQDAVKLGTLVAKSAGGGAFASAVMGPIVAGAIGEGQTTVLASAISSIAGAVAGAGASALMASAAIPFGSTVLGANENNGVYSFDCWKPVLHDKSTFPSNGLLLKDVIGDPRIEKVDVEGDCLVLQNVWDERFRIYFLELPWGQIGAHAEKVY